MRTVVLRLNALVLSVLHHSATYSLDVSTSVQSSIYKAATMVVVAISH